MNAPLPVARPVSCGSCDWVGSEGDVCLSSVDGLDERLTPGPMHGEVPAGQCPECKSLVYLADDDSAMARAYVAHGKEMLAALGAAEILLASHYPQSDVPGKTHPAVIEVRAAIRSVRQHETDCGMSNADADDEG